MTSDKLILPGEGNYETNKNLEKKVVVRELDSWTPGFVFPTTLSENDVILY